MTITVTPDPLSTPPRVQIEVEVEVGGIMQTVALYRTVGGVRELVNQQPGAGFDQRTVLDYMAPYETPIVYDWETEYVSPTALTTEFDETWASLAGWTVTNGLDGTWGVSGGVMRRGGGPDRDAKLSRALTPGRYKITFDDVPGGIPLIDFGGFQLNTESGQIVAGTASTPYSPGFGAPWVVDVTPAGVSLTTSVGTYFLSAPGVEVTKVEFSGAALRTSVIATGTAGALGGPPFYSPIAVAYASNRTFVLCLDQSNVQHARIGVYEIDGDYLTSIDFVVGTGNGQLDSPTDLAVDGSGRLVVADSGNNRVQRFTIGGSGAGTTLTYFDKWGSAGSGDGQFNGLNGVAVDAAGAIYTIEGNAHRVQKFTSAGVYSTKWGSFGSGNLQFYTPTGIAADGTSVFVVDAGLATTNAAPQLRKFTTAGVYVARVGAVGSGQGQWELNRPPAAVAAVNGAVFVSDTSRRIQAFSQSLEYSSTIPAPDATYTNEVALGVTLIGTTSYVFAVGRVLTGYGVETIAVVAAVLDDVLVQRYGGVYELAETADAVQLTPDRAWLIHPARPSLSCAVSYDDQTAPLFETIGPVRQAATSTMHQVLGESKPIVVTTGPRASDQLELTLTLETIVAETTLRGLLADETPILIRIPPSWGVDFADGFYRVGDLEFSRVLQMYDQPARLVRMPLVNVKAPAVNVTDNSGWTWATLAAEFPTWAAVAAAFETWADVLSNTRRAGF